jgi:hypothetical protein
MAVTGRVRAEALSARYDFAGRIGPSVVVRLVVLGCRVGSAVSSYRNEWVCGSASAVSLWGRSFLDLWDTPPVREANRPQAARPQEIHPQPGRFRASLFILKISQNRVLRRASPSFGTRGLGFSSQQRREDPGSVHFTRKSNRIMNLPVTSPFPSPGILRVSERTGCKIHPLDFKKSQNYELASNVPIFPYRSGPFSFARSIIRRKRIPHLPHFMSLATRIVNPAEMVLPSRSLPDKDPLRTTSVRSGATS